MITYRSNSSARSLKPSRHYVGKFDAPITTSPPNDFVYTPEAFNSRPPGEPKPPVVRPARVEPLPPKPPNQTRVAWAERQAERNARIIKLLDEGHSAGQVAQVMGLSRNTICGVRHRHARRAT